LKEETFVIHFVKYYCSTTGRRTVHVSAPRIGTIYKFDAVVDTDRISKNGIQMQICTKLYNLCGMTVYEKKSMEVYKKKHFLIWKYLFVYIQELRFEDYKVNRKFSKNIFHSNTITASSTLGLSLFENKPAMSTASSFV
jgi:hypothetical protein